MTSALRLWPDESSSGGGGTLEELDTDTASSSELPFSQTSQEDIGNPCMHAETIHLSFSKPVLQTLSF